MYVNNGLYGLVMGLGLFFCRLSRFRYLQVHGKSNPLINVRQLCSTPAKVFKRLAISP